MTTAKEIIHDAYREGNIVSIGHEETAEELAEALPRLNNILLSLFGTELGEFLGDWAVPPQRVSGFPADWPLLPLNWDLQEQFWPYPMANTRIVAALADNRTLYFPLAPGDGARMAFVDTASVPGVTVTLAGNGRLIEGVTEVVATPADLTGAQWLYRADLANWVRVRPLTVDDELPLPQEFDDYFITALAYRLASRHGKDVDATTIERNRVMLKRIQSKYAQAVPVRSSDLSYEMLDTTPYRERALW